jgi:hypothetical protein
VDPASPPPGMLLILLTNSQQSMVKELALPISVSLEYTTLVEEFIKKVLSLELN